MGATEMLSDRAVMPSGSGGWPGFDRLEAFTVWISYDQGRYTWGIYLRYISWGIYLQEAYYTPLFVNQTTSRSNQAVPCVCIVTSQRCLTVWSFWNHSREERNWSASPFKLSLPLCAIIIRSAAVILLFYWNLWSYWPLSLQSLAFWLVPPFKVVMVVVAFCVQGLSDSSIFFSPNSIQQPFKHL